MESRFTEVSHSKSTQTISVSWSVSQVRRPPVSTSLPSFLLSVSLSLSPCADWLGTHAAYNTAVSAVNNFGTTPWRHGLRIPANRDSLFILSSVRFVRLLLRPTSVRPPQSFSPMFGNKKLGHIFPVFTRWPTMFRVISCVVSGQYRTVREENPRGGLLTLSRLHLRMLALFSETGGKLWTLRRYRRGIRRSSSNAYNE